MRPTMTVAEMADQFLKRFEEFQPSIYLNDDNALLCSLRLHNLFRVFRRPVLVLLGTYASIEQAFARQPDWLDSHISTLLPSPEARGEPILFILGPPGSEAQATRYLGDQVLALEQPLIPFSALFARNKSPSNALRDVIIAYVPIRQFSPYRIDTVASQRMFFGRKDILNQLRSAHGSHIVVGPRRIGKSSLARNLQHLLGSVKRFTGEPMLRCSYVDVSGLGNDASNVIWHTILRGFNLERRDFAAGGRIAKLVGSTRRYDISAPMDEALALGSLIASFPGELTIILDEVDKWVEAEAANGWPTLNRLRAMTDEGRARTLLIGYESLALLASNDHFPFIGRGSNFHLGPISFPDVERLVVEPMEEMGLLLAGKDHIVRIIWDTTSGMPHVVQDICAHIVEQAFDSTSNKTVTMSMLKRAIESAPTVNVFRHQLLYCEFPLASAIAGVLSGGYETTSAENGVSASRMTNSPTIGDIVAILEREGYIYDPKDFVLALTYLEIRFILAPADAARTQWRWTNEIARETMQRMIASIDRRRWLKSTLAEHQEGSWRKQYTLVDKARLF